MDTDAVFHEQHDKLLPVHQGDGVLVWLGGFPDGARAEIAGGDNHTLLVRAQAAAHLLHYRGLDVLFPSLDLNGHPDADHIAYYQGLFTLCWQSCLSLFARQQGGRSAV